MATIAVLDIAFRARTKAFTAGVRGAGRTIGRFVHRTAAGMKMAAGGFVALGAAVVGAGYAMSRFLKPTMKAIDNVAKLSDALGISTEALTGMQYASRIAGTSIEQFDKALKIMSRRVGEAAIGSGEGATAMRDWGLSVDELLSRSPDEQFGLIADRMNELGSQSEKAAMAADMFGRSGVELINVLSLGSKGIEQMIRQNVLLGGSFSDIDADKIEAANDAWTRMGVVVKGIRNRLAIDLAPTIEKVARFGAAAFANMGTGWQIWITRMHLGWVRLASRIEFFVAETLPEAFRRIEAKPVGFLDAMFGVGNEAKDFGAAWVGAWNLIENAIRAPGVAWMDLFETPEWLWADIDKGIEATVKDLGRAAFLGAFEGFEKGMADQFGEMPKFAAGVLEDTLNAELDALVEKYKAGFADVAGMEFLDTGELVLALDPETKDVMGKLAQAMLPATLLEGSRADVSFTTQSRYRAMDAVWRKQVEEQKKTRKAMERGEAAITKWVDSMGMATITA